jgi:uncharacterized protein
MTFTLEEVKKNDQVLEFIEQTRSALAALSYTDHGLIHANFVTGRAQELSEAIGLSEREKELASIASFCHDMGNFLSRSHHSYMGALLFHQVFNNNFEPREMAIIMQAIANHDRGDLAFANKVSAITVLADKSDVRRSRVITRGIEKIKSDIHERVNYATQKSKLRINSKEKRIDLILEIDTEFVPVMEYFEIFTDRMVYCRIAAEYLGYNFGLIINDFKLL